MGAVIVAAFVMATVLVNRRFKAMTKRLEAKLSNRG